MSKFLLPNRLVLFYHIPEPPLPLSCVEERAKGECAVLLVKGEVEDVQPTDARHPHWFAIHNVTVMSHVCREAFWDLTHMHVGGRKGGRQMLWVSHQFKFLS